MTSADNEFFEKYKNLDKLCSEIYSCSGGISQYIADMQDQSLLGQAYIESWSSDLKNLKRIRRIRNQLAHSSSDSQISKPEDIKYVIEFRDRILSGADPLASLRRATAQKRDFTYQSKKEVPFRINDSMFSVYDPQQYKLPKENKKGTWIWILIGVLMLILTLITLHILGMY